MKTRQNGYMDNVPYRFHNKSDNPLSQLVSTKWFIPLMLVLVVLLLMFGDKIF